MRSILVLEDDENLRELLVDVLESLDYAVEGASGPEVALHLAQEIPFEVVISDVRMAGPVDGLGVLEQLKQQRPQLRCIVMTGYADEMAPVRALQIQVDDYLYKPFDVQSIVAALERVKRAQQQNQWFRKVLGKLLGQPDPAQLLQVLQGVREVCLKDFFVAVRSNLLYSETALDTWDRLEELEQAYLQIAKTPGSWTPEALREMRQRYQLWRERLGQATHKQELLMTGQRAPDKVDRHLFKRFVERIKAGQIGPAELSLAFSLRRMPAEKRAEEPEYSRLWQILWG